METNPWVIKGRVFWKEDPRFQEFNTCLYQEFWTFEKALEVSTLVKIIPENQKEAMKTRWLEYVTEWNKVRGIGFVDRTKGFAALTFIFVSFPYHLVSDIGKYFTQFEVQQINVCYYYNTDDLSIPLLGAENLFDCGPVFPPAYLQWLDEKYDRASWWLSYMVYEKNHGLPPIIDSPPTDLR